MSEIDFRTLPHNVLRLLTVRSEEISRLSARVKVLEEAIEIEKNAEMFEDGLSGDLACEGITRPADAYMRGRQDVLDALAAALSTRAGEGGA